MANRKSENKGRQQQQQGGSGRSRQQEQQGGGSRQMGERDRDNNRGSRNDNR